jgi:hypothetical protein
MKKTFSLLIILSFLFSCSGNKKTKTSELSFPVYGNYCGPLYPSKGMKPTPIDEVDSACKNHDQCYGDQGYFNKNCDLKIIQDLKAITPKNANENLAKKLLIFYFQEATKI